MKKGAVFFLQAVLIMIGIGALALMLLEPHLEGRNANASLFQIYFNDPFLAYVYIASVAFFVALYQAFRLLGYIGKNRVFSQASVNTLRTIKYCAMTLIGFVVGAEGYIFIVSRKMEEDIAGGVMMGIILSFLSAVVAIVAAVFEKTLQSAVDMKSESDLTV
jgi:hypothetical protein